MIGQHKKAENTRKERKKKYRQANVSNATIPGTSVPLVVPGTTTRNNQLKQARRWLSDECRADRFSHQAIKEVQLLFHSNDATRAATPYDAMSDEAKQIVSTFEFERSSAQANGQGDWWTGPSRKGTSLDEQNKWKQAWEVKKAMKSGDWDAIGVEIDGHVEEEDRALRSIKVDSTNFGSLTFNPGAFDDDDVDADDEDAVTKQVEAMDLTEG